MKERPILFSEALVRAILAGQKTETRRPVKVLPEGHNGGKLLRVVPSQLANLGDLWDAQYDLDNPRAIRCPFGAPGDRLWVRECWGIGSRPDPFEGCVDGIEYRADVAYLVDEHDSLPLYRVDTPEGVCIGDYVRKGWRPSIHMPRWASRITLDITSIGVERVQDITEEGAQREGFPDDYPVSTARGLFHAAWQSIYPGSWDRNDFVWVVGFKVAEVKR